MKIICIGRNYREHAKELNNAVPTAPVVFMKPATALIRDNKAFFHPEFSKDIHYEAEVVLKIGKNGKYIHPAFAKEYIQAVTVGIDFTARDLQQQQKEKGLPWEIAKAFDGSAVVGNFIPVEELGDLTALHFSLNKNNETVQSGFTGDVLFDFTTIICYVSQFFTLQMGDLIYTGTPVGVGKINIGDIYEGFLENQQVFTCEIK